MNTRSLIKYLRDNGLRPSPQRLEILTFLRKNANHPTVDTIFLALKEKIPSLSRTTVYNTLAAFIDAGIANIVFIDGGEARYEAEVEEHGHFICDKCEQIYDFKFADCFFDCPSDDLKNFLITERNVVLRGICADCKARENIETNNSC